MSSEVWTTWRDKVPNVQKLVFCEKGQEKEKESQYIEEEFLLRQNLTTFKAARQFLNLEHTCSSPEKQVRGRPQGGDPEGPRTGWVGPAVAQKQLF